MRNLVLTLFLGLIVMGCHRGPAELAPPRAVTVELVTDATGLPPSTGAVIRVKRSADDGAGRHLVEHYIPLRRMYPHPSYRGFHYVELPRDPAHPDEVAFADVSVTPNAKYEYRVWATSSHELPTLFHDGALPSQSPPSEVVQIPSPTNNRVSRSKNADLEVRPMPIPGDDGTHLRLEIDPIDEPGKIGYLVTRSMKPTGPFTPFFGSEIPLEKNGSKATISHVVPVTTPDVKWYFEVWNVVDHGDSTHIYINGTGVIPERAFVYRYGYAMAGAFAAVLAIAVAVVVLRKRKKPVA